MKARLIILCTLFLSTTVCFGGPWSEPVLLTELNDSAGNNAQRPCLSRDGLSMYFYRRENNESKLWEATRTSVDSPFTQERELSELDVGKNLYYVWVNDDNTRLYYTRHEDDSTKAVIWQADRSSPSDPWQNVMSFSDIHTNGHYDSHPSVTGDELTLYFSKVGGTFMATRSSVDEQFQNLTLLSELNDGSNTAGAPSISPDGLTMFFHQIRDGGPTFDIFEATRATTGDIFSNIEKLDFCTDLIGEVHPYVTPDGTEIYYSTVSGDGIWYSYEVPEPGTLGLLTLGVIFLRKRK